jgi:2-dehydropantoate 2-reductase
MEKARLLVIGAGVNGSVIATRLFNHRLDVTVLARGEHFNDIQNDGIIIENPFNHKRSVTKLPVIDHLDPGDVYDYILVVVRKNQVAGLLPVLAANQSPNIVIMGNNLVGPEAFTRVVEKERILLGSVLAAGRREGKLIRALTSTPFASPFGEIDGSVTPRLQCLIRILNGGGVKARISTEMVDFDMTHAVGVALIGKLVMNHHCDLHALARSTEELRDFVEARIEAHQAMKALGHKVIPESEDNIRTTPKFIQVEGMRMLLNSKLGEVGLAYHVSQAPDEIQQLVNELRELVDRAGVPVPHVRKILES